ASRLVGFGYRLRTENQTERFVVETPENIVPAEAVLHHGAQTTNELALEGASIQPFAFRERHSEVTDGHRPLFGHSIEHALQQVLEHSVVVKPRLRIVARLVRKLVGSARELGNVHHCAAVAHFSAQAVVARRDVSQTNVFAPVGALERKLTLEYSSRFL